MDTEQPVDDTSLTADASADEPQTEVEQRSSDSWGVAAVVSGVLLLSPLAIVLSHVALNRVKREPGRSSTLAVAGMILGYLGLVVTVGAIAVYLAVLAPGLDRAHVDDKAQADVTAIGNAVVEALQSDAVLPEVTVAGETYLVGGQTVDAMLEASRTVVLDGTTAADWCVELAYEGGDQGVVSYVATDGFHPNECD